MDIVTEGTDPADEDYGGLGSVEAVEESRAQVPVGSAAGEYEVDGSKDIGIDGNDGFLLTFPLCLARYFSGIRVAKLRRCPRSPSTTCATPTLPVW